jgi:hypothetical protein
MGLETAVFVMEKSIGLSNEGQRVLIESIKKKINEDKISVSQKNLKQNIHQKVLENITDVRASF